MSGTNQHHDEDDIDELDDVLDQFDAKPSSSQKPSTSSQQPAERLQTSDTGADASGRSPQVAGSSLPEAAGREESDGLPSGFDDELSKQFAAELSKGMEEMFGSAPAGSLPPGAPQEDKIELPGQGGQVSEEEMMSQFERIMEEMGLGQGSGGGPPSSSSKPGQSATKDATSATGNQPEAFPDVVKETMSRLRKSSGANAAGGAGGGADPFADFSDEDMSKLLSSLGGGDMDSEEGMSKALEKLMGEMMGKEVLYEPLKELKDKYKPYLASPPAGLPQEDLERYKEQSKILDQVVATFENPDYENGSDAKKQELKGRVSELMTKMQEAGAPPEEVVGEMPEGMDGIPGLGGQGNEDCVVM
ncbi:unnamed protein product [Jaminaea pallidilutea]